MHNRILCEQKTIIYTCACTIENVNDMLRGEMWVNKKRNSMQFLQNISLARKYLEGENYILIVYVWNCGLNFSFYFLGVSFAYILLFKYV